MAGEATDHGLAKWIMMCLSNGLLSNCSCAQMSAAVCFGPRNFFWGSASYRVSEMVKVMRINDGLLLSYEWSIYITLSKAQGVFGRT